MNVSCDIQSDLMRADKRRVLGLLLQDKTSKRNILWGTDMYAERGTAYAHDSEITSGLITGVHAGLIRSRAQKHQDQQSERTKTHAEVFTPMWVCAMMIDALDDDWFGAQHVFTDKSGHRTQRVAFPEGKTWQDYVRSTRLEITCGEAPFLVNRYDAATGEPVPVEKRIGILDRKLRVVDENAADEDEWMHWVIVAFRSTFGYEFQGDNLLIARLNLLATFEEYLDHRWHREATDRELRKIANIIVWNVWQMDGLRYRIPFDTTSDAPMDLFESAGLEDSQEIPATKRISRCRVYDWSSNRSQVLVSERGKATMKFDYIIGNPPYQEEVEGDNKTYAKPIYDRFLDASYKLGNVVEMIHPARFLFNAGSTPKAWNEKMLNDEHLKVLWYEADSKKVFSNTEIKGGIAVTIHNARAKFGRIKQFIPYPELKTAVDKIQASPSFVGLNTIAVSRTAYRLTEKLHSDYPDVAKRLSAGHRYDMSTNILELLPEVFHDSIPDDGKEYIQIVGRAANTRVIKYIRREYVNHVENLDAWKLLMPKASGTGDFGETLADIILAQPGTGSTETFMSMGNFADEAEAVNCLSYVKTRFVRALLGVLKTTQDITPAKWKYVPLQDFTAASDIDWTQSVAYIDKQLYKKYNLTGEEIDFIEKNVKEMK
ncbi:Eco57I restriction-modification methylase domain-containing protein [Bifidobacterium apri]|uniref:Eco57I restriction-modification methylase domain-containing protein n=1 Tax=Bifidobacterium apri TaxID=1769423 RepID=UPI00197AE642|nr:Eco57I restriction-modification methylase domain-containing protein [Bifidobacterium apri]